MKMEIDEATLVLLSVVMLVLVNTFFQCFSVGLPLSIGCYGQQMLLWIEDKDFSN